MRRLLIALAVSVAPSLAIAGHGHSGGHSGGTGVGASSTGARMSGPVGGAARAAVPLGRPSGARIANMGGPWKGTAGGWSKGMHHGHHHHRHGRFFFAGAPWRQLRLLRLQLLALGKHALGAAAGLGLRLLLKEKPPLRRGFFFKRRFERWLREPAPRDPHAYPPAASRPARIWRDRRQVSLRDAAILRRGRLSWPQSR
jgi:hypothetical protein